MSALTIINRIPGPGAIDVPVNATIVFDVAETSGSGLIANPSNTSIWIDGIPALVNGVYQAGFTGPESGFSTPQVDVRRFAVDPNDPLSGGTSHSIRVVTQIASQPTTIIDVTWSFFTEDLMAPAILTAKAVSLSILRVTFSEDVTGKSSSGQGDALNPSSWEVTLATQNQTRLPAVVACSVTSITKRSSVQYDLKLSPEPTPQATYDLMVDVRDIAGNLSLPPGNATTFVGFQPFVDERREYDYLSWLPGINLSEDDTGDYQNFILCLQEIGELLLYELDAWPTFLDPDTAPEDFVDAMLDDLGNPFRFSLTLTQKRKLVKLLRAIYKQKGTDQGIINAIRLFLGLEVTIEVPTLTMVGLGYSKLGVDFVLSSSELADIYTFIIVSPVVLTQDQIDKINAITRFMRRAPCHWRIESPTVVATPDHWALGYSDLGIETILHS